MHDLFTAGAGVGCGYRLHKLEVSNWGTFDSTRGAVHVLRPEGATALLIGENGCGKSTLVDALLTLLVRPVVRNYNVAAGAKKRERDERTYIKGACNRLSRHEDNGTQIEFLRPDGKHYSALLACFRNDRDEAFTLAQILYLNAEGGAEKVYCFAEGERSIADDCAKLSGARMRRQMEERGFRATDKYADYHRWLEKKTGMLPKAMDMFNQTVAVKDIQSLNDFIRDHMLEAKPWGERIDSLQSHFTQLTEAHESLVRVRKQFELLTPIFERGGEYRAKAAELASAEAVWQASAPFFHTKRIELMAPVVEMTLRELTALAGEMLRLDAETESARDEARQLKNEMEQAGGERLREIPHRIANHKLAAAGKRERHARFRTSLAAAGVVAEVTDAAGLAELHRSLPPILQSVAAAAQALKLERDRKIVDRGETHRQLAEDRREFEALGTRQTKLPEELAEVRRRLCEDLRLSEGDLPFVAELVAVLPEEREWEASAEKVLRSFALSLLVPQRHYAAVTGHLDRNRVRDDRGRGQRLAYLRVADRPTRAKPTPHPQSLVRKLRLRDRHSLVPWVLAELEERFDYVCCDTIEQFQAAHGMALTRERHVKWGSVRHEKDDRDRAADPRNFVLGWDNKEKRRHLAAQLERLGKELTALDGQIDRLDAELGHVEAKRAAANELAQTLDYAALDFASDEREIERLQEEKKALEEGDDKVRTLRTRLSQVEARQADLQGQRDEAIRAEERLRVFVADGRRLIDGAHNALDEYARRGELDKHAERFAEIEARFAHAALTAADVVQREQPFRDACRAEADRLREQVGPLKDQLCGLMNRYLREFPDERADLDATIEYLDSFCGAFDQIRSDDLPRHEQRFKERLNEKVLQEIGLLHGAFRTESAEIVSKIDVLNQSLGQLEYRPGTFMRLEPRPVRDHEITEFQTGLRECLAGTFEGTLAADEARYLRIAKLLERLREDDRWREKVSDVRRWFDFAARELEAGTNDTRAYYEDSTGQSGGEKAKLAFTILVAAIAYQYDIDPGRRASDRFHFVVVDEMFSKVDDRHSEYALELFKKFGLQLLIVAPLDAKARVTEPYVGCYLHVAKDARTNHSEIARMTAQEFEAAVLRPAAAS